MKAKVSIKEQSVLLSPSSSPTLQKSLSNGSEKAKWKIITFHKGKRKTYLVHGPARNAAPYLSRFKEQGIKAHLVSRVRAFPPPDDEFVDMRRAGYLWCPLCRAWRKFEVPYSMRPYTELNIKICMWCHVSEYFFHVRYYNGSFDEQAPRKRERKTTRRKRF